MAVGTSATASFPSIASSRSGSRDIRQKRYQASFSPLSLQDVYGTILYYMEHREQMDAFFRTQDALFHQMKAENEASKPEFYEEMRQRVARFRETERHS